MLLDAPAGTLVGLHECAPSARPDIEDGAMTEPGTASPADRRTGSVVVVGSVNVDLVVSLDHFPGPGETRMARYARTHLGGKGLSQAIAASRFGSPCSLIAVVGDDANGRLARAALDAAGVDAAYIRTSSLPTGQAFVWVDGSAENMIAVVPGANAELRSLTLDDVLAIGTSSVVLTQFESGQEIAIDAIRAGRASGATVILNAAPAMPVPDVVLAEVDLLVVNEVEVMQLRPATDLDTAARHLAATCGAVLVTLGARGGRLYRNGRPPLEIGAPAVDAVDTTGAGDVSCGVIAGALAQGESLDAAIALAFAAGALAVQVEGNASAIPTREQVLALAPLRPSA
jgi:ribokinase